MPPKGVKKDVGRASSKLLKTKHPDSSGTRGTSHFLEDFPLDIFGEVIGHLEPLDVLHLTRTDKHLRALLMNGAMASYWKRARENIEGLPPCPSDLSEPAYANLMFTSHCHNCFSEDQDVLTHLEARVQLCYKCTLEKFKKWKDMPQKIDQKLVDFIPATSEALTVSERKQPEQVANTKWRTAARTRFHIETAQRLQAQYDGLRTPKEKAKWLEEQRSAWNSIDEHAALCRNFVRGDMPKDEEEAMLFLSQRRERLRQEMGDLGYEDEFEQCGRFSVEETPLGAAMYSRISTAEKLSEKEWHTIKGPMVAYMDQVRTALLVVRKAEQLHDWVVARVTPPYTEYVLARPATISSLPSIKQVALASEIIRHFPANADALDDKIQMDALHEAVEQMPELVRDHSSEVEEYLLNLIRRAPPYEGQTIDRDALLYATTMFHCATCEASLAFPDVLVHEDFYKKTWPLKKRRPAGRIKANGGADAEAEDDIEADIQRAFKDYKIWAPGKGIRFNEAAYHHTLRVLNSLRMDPLTTCQALRVLNPYVELLCKCRNKSLSESKHDRVVNRWSEIVQMVGLHRSMEYDDALRVFNEADVQQAPGYQLGAVLSSNWKTSTICPFCGWFLDDPIHLSQEYVHIRRISEDEMAELNTTSYPGHTLDTILAKLKRRRSIETSLENGTIGSTAS